MHLHVSEQVARIAVVVQRGFSNHAQRLQLICQRAFANDELSGVCAIKTIDAIRADDTVLDGTFVGIAVVLEEARRTDYVLGDAFEGTNDVLVASSR